ncbi:Short-chain dehydrogenase [Geosmithia morbida]|uniref:Short-chain dehydrogenase n=1 Tax=Geosmithia morbida TaxID=1094350 RepID=A0A9P4YQK5_9HYPO|nr:Short-chain dehydrogenase [Geosmithia morbida]KAF4120747.1 Short-chain dehydrogenase [Geosmithia morbida]
MSLVWFITGASNGLGLSMALQALQAGHKVIAAMRNPERSAAASRTIEEAGGSVFQLDTTESQEAIVSKMERAEAVYGQIDVLVNNAGYSVLGACEDFSEEEITTLFRTNVFGPMFITQGVLPGMRARRTGTIVNLSSVAGQDGSPACGLYSASKFGLEGYSESLSREVGEFGISVLIVEPGAFRTNFLAAMQVTGRGVGGSFRGGGSVVAQALDMYRAANGKQVGDPEKAVARIVDVVTGRGDAGELKGKVLRLVLGRDAHTRIVNKTDKLREDLEASKLVAYSTDM